jgi:hypothetical protein
MSVHYLNAFDGVLLPPSIRQTVAGQGIPGMVRSLEEVGLAPKISNDLQPIVEIQAENPDRMRLFQPFNPLFQPRYSAHDTVVLTVERDDQPVACAGTRLFWVGESLANEMESLRLFYSNVRGMSRPRENVVVTAPTAKRIGDCNVALTGAVFVKQGESPVVVKAMMRLLHLWVFVHWKWTWLIGLASRPIVRGYGYDTYGFTSAEMGIWREGREYLLLLAPRRHYADLIGNPSFHDLSVALGEPSEVAKYHAAEAARAARAGHEEAAA